MITFQGDDFQILGKTGLDCKRFTSQRSIEKIYNPKFSQVSALRKKEVRSFLIQEEACLKFGQAEGYTKVLGNNHPLSKLNSFSSLSYLIYSALCGLSLLTSALYKSCRPNCQMEHLLFLLQPVLQTLTLTSFYSIPSIFPILLLVPKPSSSLTCSDALILFFNNSIEVYFTYHEMSSSQDCNSTTSQWSFRAVQPSPQISQNIFILQSLPWQLSPHFQFASSLIHLPCGKQIYPSKTSEAPGLRIKQKQVQSYQISSPQTYQLCDIWKGAYEIYKVGGGGVISIP